MSKRSYHQFCPLAYSLDQVGERWTLLLVRELLFGPRRYTDLLNGLPGIGTNLLAKRLKDMEQAGIIRQRLLPPPAGSTVYELTDRGRELEEAMAALARWGARYVQLPAPEDDYMGTIPTMAAFVMLFDARIAEDVSITCEVHADHDVFHVTVREGRLDIQPGAAVRPDVVIAGEPKAILNRIVTGPVADGGKFTVESGSVETFARFASAFHFPNGG
ncbi:MAG: helix-turn-helix transcriptional regulator [Anaerolineae bacterium]|nr:helix-turn-helix transcriptional regulator [Anaerolineae bacterium]